MTTHPISLDDAVRLVAEMDREVAAEARATPARVTATDRSGMITAVLGPTGRPVSLTVTEGWLRGLGSESFGAAVAEAVDAARTRRGETRDPGVGSRPAPDPQPRERLAVGRPFGALLADVIMLMSVPVGEPGDGTDAGTAVAGFGKLTLTVRPDGTVFCHADPHWVAARAGTELTDELNRLLGTASADLAGPGGRLGDLIGQLHLEALAGAFGGAVYVRPTAAPIDPEERR
jgi:hypothetical protein